MKKSVPFLFLLIVACAPLLSQKNVNSFVVVSYNVENLFDTINSPDFDDDEFTPGGSKKWTYERYEKKLRDLGKVIRSVPGKEVPALLGLAEVENKEVLEDLLKIRGLRKGKYSIVHEDGPDPRGIECALLYRPEFFTYNSHEYIKVDDIQDPDYIHRRILHVSGTGPEGSNLHIFVNHWKSRSGGEKETERKRMYSAITLRKQLDLLLARDADVKVIILGDFNDEPTNNSIHKGLSATNKRKNISMGEYYNFYYDLHNTGKVGTYNYQGRWNMLDQVIVSYSLLNQKQGLSTQFERGRILKEDFMMYESEKYKELLPSATYGGPQYYGGPSDHLPVYVEFTW